MTSRPAQSDAHRKACPPSSAAPATTFCHTYECRWAARIVDVDLDHIGDYRTPEAALATMQLRRIVRARVALHVARRPELAVAVPVLTGAARPRELGDDRIYTLTAALRARLRDDEVLGALWEHGTE